jgi:hypothetical protein
MHASHVQHSLWALRLEDLSLTLAIVGLMPPNGRGSLISREMVTGLGCLLSMELSCWSKDTDCGLLFYRDLRLTTAIVWRSLLYISWPIAVYLDGTVVLTSWVLSGF